MMIKRKLLLAGLSGALTLFGTTSALAQIQGYIGEIQLFGGDYCYTDTVSPNGQRQPKDERNPLYKLLGTTYGDINNEFLFPNLLGRTIVGQSATNPMGNSIGGDTVILNTDNLPMHTHTAVMRASTGGPDAASPTEASLATFGSELPVYVKNAAPNINMAAGSVSVEPAGGGFEIPNLPPYQTIGACMVIKGNYPQPPAK